MERRHIEWIVEEKKIDITRDVKFSQKSKKFVIKNYGDFIDKEKVDG